MKFEDSETDTGIFFLCIAISICLLLLTCNYIEKH